MIVDGGLIFLAQFTVVFLKAFQQQNVIHENWGLVPFVSMGLATTEVTIVLFVVKTGWHAIPFMGAGAGLGAICAMLVHKKLFRRKF
jgi:hypothetical protein